MDKSGLDIPKIKPITMKSMRKCMEKAVRLEKKLRGLKEDPEYMSEFLEGIEFDSERVYPLKFYKEEQRINAIENSDENPFDAIGDIEKYPFADPQKIVTDILLEYIEHAFNRGVLKSCDEIGNEVENKILELRGY